MKRWYLAAVAGVWWITPVSAQEGVLAPTTPVVPSPMLKNGGVLTPAGGNWGTGSRSFSLSKWSPFRNPATASATDPVAPPIADYSRALPPLPAGVGVVDGGCGPAGCGGGHGRARSCWDRFKAWLTYHPSDTGLPRLQPTPYQTPLMGMFPCTPYGSAGCSGSGGCAVADSGMYGPTPVPPLAPFSAPPAGQPLTPPRPYSPPPMPQPVAPGTSASAVMMPPRGAQGPALQPTWQGRITPAPADTGIAGYRFATPESQSTTRPAPITNTALKVPVLK